MTYKGYLIDLDGTVYRGEDCISAGGRSIQRLRERNVPCILATNNTMRTPEKVQGMLVAQFNVCTPLKTIYTATMATTDYMNDMNRGKTVYMIGETGSKAAIVEAGYVEDTKDPAYAVVRLDTQLTYGMSTVTALAIQRGAAFIGMNPNLNIPTECGLVPEADPISKLSETATHVQPVFIGEPSAVIINETLGALRTRREETIMVDDNYLIDIMAGIQNDIATLLVTTGFIKPEEAPTPPVKPDHVLASLDEWNSDEK